MFYVAELCYRQLRNWVGPVFGGVINVDFARREKELQTCKHLEVLVCGFGAAEAKELRERLVTAAYGTVIDTVVVSSVEEAAELMGTRQFDLYIFKLSPKYARLRQLVATMLPDVKEKTVFLAIGSMDVLETAKDKFHDVRMVLYHDDFKVKTAEGLLLDTEDVDGTDSKKNTLSFESSRLLTFNAVKAEAVLRKISKQMQIADEELDAGEMMEGQTHLMAAMQHAADLELVLQDLKGGLQKLLVHHQIIS